MKYILRDKETGTIIDEFIHYDKAFSALERAEATDKAEGNFTEDFYEIISKSEPYYYDYSDLIKCYTNNKTDINLDSIGKWFELYGQDFWNGECYTCEELNGRLYPIFKDLGYSRSGLYFYEQVGWELR